MQFVHEILKSNFKISWTNVNNFSHISIYIRKIITQNEDYGEFIKIAGKGSKKMGESLPPFHGVHFYYHYLSINLHFNSTIMAECAGILRVERSSIVFPEITS